MPALSVVIPTIGRSTLTNVLDRLERQRGAKSRFEVVVVADPEARDVRTGSRPYAVRVLHAGRRGASAARNTGWRDARGRLVLFLGDDMLPSRDLIAEHLAWHERHPEDEVAVLGRVRWARSLRVTSFMRWLEHGMQFDYPSIEGVDAGWGRFYTANVSLKRSLLELGGGFDEDFPIMYEDLDLARRLHDRGLRLLYNRGAAVEHDHAATIEGWRERMKVVAAAERRFTEKHPDVEPYFLPRFEHLATLPPAHGRGAKLARWIPRDAPLIGRPVWQSADVYYGQQLAPAFLDAWRASGRPTESRPI
jgi:GT2 family glycosyltransferase